MGEYRIHTNQYSYRHTHRCQAIPDLAGTFIARNTPDLAGTFIARITPDLAGTFIARITPDLAVSKIENLIANNSQNYLFKLISYGVKENL